MKLKPHHLLWLGLWGSLGWILMELTSPVPKPNLQEHRDIVAWVDGVPISSQRYFKVLASLATQKDAPPMDANLRRTVMDDLIAEELLLSRALALDLPRNAALARRHLLSAMTQLAQTEAPIAVEESELKAYFQRNRARFRTRRQVQIARMVFKDRKPDFEKRAQEAMDRLRMGEDFDALKKELADTPVAPLPKGLMPSATLRHYVGPTAAYAATQLAVGKSSDILPMGGGVQLLKVLATTESPAPDFHEVAQSVRALFERDAKARQLQRYVHTLRAHADIRINEEMVGQRPIPKEALSQARAPTWDAGPQAMP